MGLEFVGPTPEEMGIKPKEKKSLDTGTLKPLNIADVDKIIAEDPEMNAIWQRKLEADRQKKQDLQEHLAELDVEGMSLAQLIEGLTLIYNQKQDQPALALEAAISKYGKQLAFLQKNENKVMPFLLAERDLGLAEDDLQKAKKQFVKMDQFSSVEVSPLVIKDLLDEKQELSQIKKELEDKVYAGYWEVTDREREIAETFADWRGAEWIDPHLIDFVEETMKRSTGEKEEVKEEKRQAA